MPHNDLVSQTSSNHPNQVYSADLFSGLQYRMVGPSRGGRVTAVAGHADQPATFYMGATGGGVWKTTDFGQSWRPVSDGYFATGSIGAIRVADSDPRIIYVGTGSDGIRSNVITGRGVYKSTDGGETWSYAGLKEVGQIGAVLIHPTNPDLLYIAAIGDAFGPTPDRGVYRSTDGGSNWESVLFVSDSTGAVDLEFAPDDPATIYASMWRAERKPWTIISGGMEGGVYKSTDAGDTWERLTRNLPAGLRGKSDLAVSAADPNRLYVLFEAPEGEGGLYRSDDRGTTFELVSTYGMLLRRPFYYLNVDADPTNADVVYVNAEGFFKSVDGGVSWQRRGTPHGDNHDMWINPNDPDLFIQSNDGGANVTRDGGETWSTQHNQPTAELYSVDVDDQFPYWLYSGQQDNTTIAVPSLPPHSAPGGPTSFWTEIGGCETGPAVPKPGNHNIVYANCKGRFGRYSKLTGQEKQYYVGAANLYGHNPRDLRFRFQRVAPIEVSPHDPDVVYHGSQYVHKTIDDGVTWETISPDLTAFEPDKQMRPGEPITQDITGEEYYSTLYAIEESPLQAGLIWAGANDGPIHATRDGGTTWTDVTPADLPSGGRVQAIDPSPHNPAKAYVAVYRYLLGDWQPYIYRTTDYGASWTRLTTGTNGVPADYPTRVVREDPDREGLLYAGTEFGMFISFDDGAHWQEFQLNLPATPVTDIKLVRQDLVLSTMGRSFWILDDVTPLHQLSDAVAGSQAHLFQPRDTYRMRYYGRGGSETDPEYPPAGAMIYYYLAEVPVGDVTLEILDGSGELVREYEGQAPRARPGAQRAPGMPGAGAFQYGARGSTLVAAAGMHRFTWDLRHSDDGPMVPPGTYQVRLSVGGWSATESFELLIDPRVAADGVTQADLVEQAELGLRVRDAIVESQEAITQLTATRQSLEGKTDAASRRADERLAEIQRRLMTGPVRYDMPMVADQLQYLSGMINRADQKLGRDAFERYEELKAALDTIVADLNAVLREIETAGG
ncbi:MAG: hypothetical protein JSW71_12845 [Gemmatimonadota bacterium]|nr:MAG: hypothetical protein JSW71_12845 [Gemmatimonadota bacterium]